MRLSSPALAALAALATALSLLFASAARADVAPPEGYVEECTVDRQCPGGRGCGTYHGESNPQCAAAAREAGMEERCHSWGATVGSSVFCPKGAPTPKKAEKPAVRSGGCGGCSTGAPGGVAPALAVPLAIALGAAIRRARRPR